MKGVIGAQQIRY